MQLNYEKHNSFYAHISGFVAGAQERKHNPADQIRSLNWDVIGTVKLELTEKNTLVPIFGEAIKRFDQREFQLQGYYSNKKRTKAAAVHVFKPPGESVLLLRTKWGSADDHGRSKFTDKLFGQAGQNIRDSAIGKQRCELCTACHN